MALVNKSFSVSVTPGMMPPVIHVSEYDVGRAYTVSILDEQGNTFAIPSGTSASIEGTLNGSVGFTQSATVSNNQVSFTLSESMTAYAGKAWCKIKLTQNSQPIQTCAFILAVDRAGVEADTVIGAPGFEEQIKQGVTEYLDDHQPFFTLPEGGQSGQALLSDGADGAYWGEAGIPEAGIPEAVKTALLACFRSVAWADDQGQTYYDALYGALYPTPPTQIYQDVEYIGFDGNQRIVTDFTVANNSFNISGKALFAKPSGEMFIVGIARASDAQAEVGTSTTDNRLFFYVPQTSAACVVANLYNTQVVFDAEYIYGTGKTLKTTINGVEVTGTETATREFSTEHFAIGSAGTATQRLGFVGRLYSCSFISDGIEHKFIPCYRIADGVIGFRNEDATEFYTNAGTGTFTKGGDV